MPVVTAGARAAELAPLDAAIKALPPIICTTWRRLISELLGAQSSTECLTDDFPLSSEIPRGFDAPVTQPRSSPLHISSSMLEGELRPAYHRFP